MSTVNSRQVGHSSDSNDTIVDFTLAHKTRDKPVASSRSHLALVTAPLSAQKTELTPPANIGRTLIIIALSLIFHALMWKLLSMLPETTTLPVEKPLIVQAALIEPPPPPPPPKPKIPEPPKPKPVVKHMIPKPPPPKPIVRQIEKPAAPPRRPLMARRSVPNPIRIAESPEPAKVAPLADLRPTLPVVAPAHPAPRPAPAPVRPAPRPAVEGPTTGPSFHAGYLHNPPPAYPMIAKRQRMQGTVLLRVQVSASGAPLGVSVQRSSGYGMLDDAAVSAVHGWRFVPAKHKGQNVSGSVLVPISFRVSS